MTPRRELVAAVAALAGTSALLLLAAGRVWVRTAPDAARLEAARALTGSALEPGLPALALVGLASGVAVLATRGGLRMAVGGVVVLAGAVATWLAVRAPDPGAHPSAWQPVAVAAAALLALTGLGIAVRGRRWPGMSARYDAPGRAARRGTQGAAPEAPSDRAVWDALDRGEDPTA